MAEERPAVVIMALRERVAALETALLQIRGELVRALGEEDYPARTEQLERSLRRVKEEAQRALYSDDAATLHCALEIIQLTAIRVLDD